MRFRSIPLLSLALSLAIAPAAAAAQAVVQPLPGTTDADRLAEQIHRLAANPQDLDALVTAGDLSIKLDDTTAAAAFFTRADKIDPRSARVKAGEAALLVRNERPGEALRYFAQAESYGLAPVTFAADRALAYDLIGDQPRAQRDYRLALTRTPGDGETIRRYALSLGISGRKQQALDTLDPLLTKTDRGAWRSRAFVLAMNGDVAGAEHIAQTMMPGGVAQGLRPFFERLPTLDAIDRAFAVHFGEVRSSPQRVADARLAPATAPLPAEAPVAVAAATPTPEPRKGKKDRRSRSVAPAAVQPAPTQVAQASPPPAATPPAPAQQRPAYVAPPPARTVAAATTTPVRTTPLPANGSAAILPRPVATAPSATSGTVIASGVPVTAPLAAAAESPATLAVTTAPVAVVPSPVSWPAVVSVVPSPSTTPSTVFGPSTPVVQAVPVTRQPVPEASAAPLPTPGFTTLASTTAPPRARRMRGEDAVLDKIIAGLSIPATELDSAAPARATPIAAEVVHGRGRKGAAETPPAADEPELTPAEKRAADRKAAAAAKALAAKKAAAEAKIAADKEAAKEAAAEKKAARANPERIWVQVAGGANEDDLPKAWAAVKKKAPEAFAGRSGYKTPLRATNRVLAGPFKTDADARAFVNTLKKNGVSGFAFTSDAGQKVEKLPSE